MAENQLGVKTRAMMEKEGVNTRKQEIQQNPGTNTNLQPQQQPQPQPQDAEGPMQPRLELTRVDQENMEEYVRKYSNINLDWYVPDLLNICVIDMIRNKTRMCDRLKASEGALFPLNLTNSFYRLGFVALQALKHCKLKLAPSLC